MAEFNEDVESCIDDFDGDAEMEEESEEEEMDELRCGVCDNWMRVWVTRRKGNKKAVCDHCGEWKKCFVNGFKHIVQTEAKYREILQDKFKLHKGGSFPKCTQHGKECRLKRGWEASMVHSYLSDHLFMVCGLRIKQDPCDFVMVASKTKDENEEQTLLQHYKDYLKQQREMKDLFASVRYNFQ